MSGLQYYEIVAVYCYNAFGHVQWCFSAIVVYSCVLCFLRILTAELGWLFAKTLVTPGSLFLPESYLSLSCLPSYIIFMLWKVSTTKLETSGFAFSFWFCINDHFVSPWRRWFRKKKKPSNFTCGALLVKQVCPASSHWKMIFFHAVL